MTGDLRAVALGRAPADLVVTGGAVLCPDGRLRERSVAVVGDRIAAVPADPEPVVGPDTRVVDAAGGTVVPGLVDAHDHVDVGAAVERRHGRYLERGTTTVVTEASLVGAGGAAGVEALLAATADLPLTVLVAIPPQPFVDVFGDDRPGDDPPGETAWLGGSVADGSRPDRHESADGDGTGGNRERDDHADGGSAGGRPRETPFATDRDDRKRLRALLDHDRVVGVGEVAWGHVVGRSTPELDDLIARARDAGGRVAGHGAGCRGPKLSAFAGVVDDDHEATRPEGVDERLERGLHVVGRRGSVRDDLAAVAAADPPRGDLSLCTDGTWAGDGAGMADVVRAAISEGVDPAAAVEAATRTPAVHLGLTDRGRVAPGDRADLVVLSDLRDVAVETVVAGGRVVVADGTATVDPRPHDYPDELAPVDCAVPAERLRVSVAALPAGVREAGGEDGDDEADDADRDGRAIVRAIDCRDGMVTGECTVRAPVVDGAVRPPDGASLAVLVDRRPDRDRGFVGLVDGPGLEGAAATTHTWGRPGALAVGGDPAALSRALDRLDAIGGGWVVIGPGDSSDGDDPPAGDRADDGESPSVVAELATPVAGVIADDGPDAVADRHRAVSEALVDLGGSPDPEMPRVGDGDPGTVLTLQTLTFPGVPALRMGFSGYVDVLDGTVVGLAPD